MGKKLPIPSVRVEGNPKEPLMNDPTHYEITGVPVTQRTRG